MAVTGGGISWASATKASKESFCHALASLSPFRGKKQNLARPINTKLLEEWLMNFRTTNKINMR